MVTSQPLDRYPDTRFRNGLNVQSGQVSAVQLVMSSVHSPMHSRHWNLIALRGLPSPRQTRLTPS